MTIEMTPMVSMSKADLDKRLKQVELDTAKKIFAEIKKHRRKMQSSDWSGDFWDYAVLLEDINYVEKKYGVKD
jgi:hypothetical protein